MEPRDSPEARASKKTTCPSGQQELPPEFHSSHLPRRGGTAILARMLLKMAARFHTRGIWRRLLFSVAVFVCAACLAPLRVALASGPSQAARPAVASQQPPAPSSSSATVDAQSAASQPAEKHVTAYTLPPDLYRKAHLLSQIAFWGEFITFVYSLIVLLLVLKWRLAPKFRDRAEKTARNRFVQSLFFTPPLIIAIAVLNIPLDAIREGILRKFGISVQSWTTWFGDWCKTEILSILLAIFLVWGLYALIRRSPRRWWLYCWLASLPIVVFLIFVQPLVVDPLFHKFEPLPQKDLALTQALETMVQHAGVSIPPERMFWMGASAKTTALNAYVTGIGASKRIVVWDTTIAKMSTPQIVYVAGHEMGHYVLNHIPKGIAFAAVALLVLFYLLYLCIGGLLARWGAGWEIRAVDDWASLPAFLFLIAIFSFAGNPISNAFSRHLEHQADQYGLEVTHGLTPDSSQIAAQSFQILGEVDLADPDPRPLDIFLFYDHPSIPDRIRYCLSYDPWSRGEQPEFVH
jgi:STE24 endopeptidase